MTRLPGVARRAVVWLVVLMGYWCMGAPRGYSEHRVTDEELATRFHRSHSMMEAQLERLRGILDAFLLGDLKGIQRDADEIAQEMLAIGRSFPPDPGAEAEQWKAMADIVKQAQLLQKAARAGQYQRAYQHYTALTSHCMACHQARRASLEGS